MKSISVKELAALGKEAAIVDVREDDEFAAVRVSGATSVPLSRFTQSLAEVPATGTVYVMCAAAAAAARPPPISPTKATTPSTSPAASTSGSSTDCRSSAAERRRRTVISGRVWACSQL
ncbi:rhodanese-like domain-containing protein [Pseudarthrobacter sp. So.54]